MRTQGGDFSIRHVKSHPSGTLRALNNNFEQDAGPFPDRITLVAHIRDCPGRLRRFAGTWQLDTRERIDPS